MHSDGDQRPRRTGGRATLLLGLVGAMAIGGAAAANGPTPTQEPISIQRAEPVAAVEPDEIRSGDDEDRAEPAAVSPAVPLDAGRNQLTERSPWAGLWGPEIEPLAAYEPQRSCLSGARPAVAALARLLEQAYPQGRDLGIARSCEAGARSEHKEGRAYDWGVRVTVPAERMAAEELVAWLLATDEHGNDFAMARRLGVMYVIWDGHIWSSSAADDGWRVYRGRSPHTDHVHLSFSWAGAVGATSFWDAARLGPWLFGHVAVERLPSSFDLGRDRYRSELGEAPGRLQTFGNAPEPAPDDAPEPPPEDGADDGDGSTSAPSPTATMTAPSPSELAPSSPLPAVSGPLLAPLVEPLLDPTLPSLDPVEPATAPPPTEVVDEVVDGVVDGVGDVVGEVGDDLDSLVDGR